MWCCCTSHPAASAAAAAGCPGASCGGSCCCSACLPAWQCVCTPQPPHLVPVGVHDVEAGPGPQGSTPTV
jgi:hypothetical protein